LMWRFFGAENADTIVGLHLEAREKVDVMIGEVLDLPVRDLVDTGALGVLQDGAHHPHR